MSFDTQKAKARFLANTRRKGNRRPDNLYDFAKFIREAINYYGSLKKVSKEVADISPNMLNRFLSALNVDKRIVPLIQKRKIDNINVLFYIQTLRPNDQIILSNLVAEGRINSTDVRAIAPLKRKFPNKSIEEIYEQVHESKDKKRYLVKFDITPKTNISLIEKKIQKVLVPSDFEIEKKNKIGTIIFSEYGYSLIKKYCKQHKILYKDLIQSFIN